MTPLILCCAAIVVTVPLGLCALYLRRIAQEVRAVRKLLQARWDYEMAKIKWRVEGSRLTPQKTSQEATQQREPAKESLSATDAERYLNQISDRLTVNQRDEH